MKLFDYCRGVGYSISRVVAGSLMIGGLMVGGVTIGVLAPSSSVVAMEVAMEVAEKPQGTIQIIEIRGNVRVEDEAILAAMISQVGEVPQRANIAEDIRAIYNLGYFSEVDIRVISQNPASRDDGEYDDNYNYHHGPAWRMVVDLSEKPAVAELEFEGFTAVSADDFEDELRMKPHTIVNQSLIAHDINLIESKYQAKGYYLVRASYEIRSESDGVKLVYMVEPGHKVYVGGVQLVGNHSFADNFLISFLQTQPFSYLRSLFGSQNFSEAAVEHDQGMLAYFYQDRGYAQVKVGSSITSLSRDRRYMDVTFELEEGERYNFGEVKYSGDLLFDDAEFKQMSSVHSGELFRISQLKETISRLGDEYGDRGYAFVNVSPDVSFDEEALTAQVDFRITQGKLAYFGDFILKGNTKTRDNVVRRELEVATGDRYSTTGLKKSQQNLESLGFFDSVRLIRSIDEERDDVIHYTVLVEEKSTGQVQASVGYTPSGYTNANWFGQGRYDEKNMFGRAYQFDVAATYSNIENYSSKMYFANPSVWNSPWSFGAHLSYTMQKVISLGFDLSEHRLSTGLNTGRTIWEQIRGSVGLEFARTEQTSVLYLSDALRLSGDTVGLTFTLSRKMLNNYIDPSQGTVLRLAQTWMGGPLGGDHSLQELEAEAIYYHPLPILENFETYVKTRLLVSQLSSFQGESPPLFKRYRLGGAFNLRGYAPNSITPRFVFWKSPFDYDRTASYPKGGNRQIVLQAEYYLPLIPQAKMNALLFADSGRVFDNDEPWTLGGFYSNIGFGVRWVTPMGPLRFEWAFPLENGRLGAHRLVFNIGY